MGPRQSKGKIWFVRATAVATLTAFSASVMSANGSAAVLNPALVPAPIPVAEKTKPKPQTRKPAETYQERIDRIAQSPRSMLPTLEENEGQPTVCVSGEFTTLRVVYDSLFESVLPSLPKQLHQNAYAARAAAHRDMDRLNVSTLAISDHPMALGADRDDPSLTYRGAISQWMVVQLLKIRDGKEAEAIPLGNITLAQAVETVWLYFFATIFTPAKIGVGLTPYLGRPFEGTDALNSVTYNLILQLMVQGSTMAGQSLYQSISNAIVSQCIARVTEEQRAEAGRPSDTVTYPVNIPAIVRETANQLALADNDDCSAVGNVPLSRIVTRTGDYAQNLAQTPQEKKAIAAETKKILASLRGAQVPHNLIPADPSDFTQAESLISTFGGIIPVIGGAPIDIILGLSHNLGQGDDMFEMVPLSDLTVTKSLTAAYFTYYLSLHLFTTIGGLLEGQVLTNGQEVGYLSPIRALTTLANIPLTYGLVNYHNVVRSMCFVEDDTNGNGRGAQNNRDRATLPSASTTTPTAARPGSTRQGSNNPASPTRRAGASSTPSTSSSTPAPLVPGLPIRIPGVN
ncbi:hypothetical protein GYA93_22305 [Gordonia desulfuricans]|uniref:Uncharacterized protein n=2 Tax=Gordonia desulfuricans TaxID=89051 RepID=A0A7K3LVM5_9ACTN|nr:hypothetical protein [Gordonia desulfuricans]NDK92269.1 hypothetical protein [Gordonia desulfuricans]